MIKALHKFILWIIDGRDCDMVVDKDYMTRWHIIPRNPILNIYYHVFTGSDGPTMHDHPWASVSIILDGMYHEQTPDGYCIRKTGDVNYRSAKQLHRIGVNKPVETLFITGPRFRQWGFECLSGWVHHKEYLARRGPERHASGCGEIDSHAFAESHYGKRMQSVRIDGAIKATSIPDDIQ